MKKNELKTVDILNNITELVFILDRSGSMGGLESDVIGGFNSMIEKQKAEEGEAFVTTVLFDDRIEPIYDSQPIGTIPKMDRNTYYVRGCTALLDAVGSTILDVSNRQDKLESEKKASKVIFVITTDGLENASREFSLKQVRNLISSKTEGGWEFIFLGANIDAVGEAGKLGIRASRAGNFTASAEGIDASFGAVGEVVTMMRGCAKMSDVDGSWKKKLK